MITLRQEEQAAYLKKPCEQATKSDNTLQNQFAQEL